LAKCIHHPNIKTINESTTTKQQLIIIFKCWVDNTAPHMNQFYFAHSFIGLLSQQSDAHNERDIQATLIIRKFVRTVNTNHQWLNCVRHQQQNWTTNTVELSTISFPKAFSITDRSNCQQHFTLAVAINDNSKFLSSIKWHTTSLVDANRNPRKSCDLLNGQLTHHQAAFHGKTGSYPIRSHREKMVIGDEPSHEPSLNNQYWHDT
jgi:hypothetical protein